MLLTRRQFTKTVAAASALAASSGASFAVAAEGVKLGLNTYSLRALPHETALPTILQAMKQLRLQDCELLYTHVEPQFGAPLRAAGPSGPGVPPAPLTPQQLEERKAAAAARTEWRVSAPLSLFEKVRARFRSEGVRIKAYAATFTSSDAELDRLFLMAKALGAESINGRVAESITDRVAAAAEKHRLKVGIQVFDVALVAHQLKACQYFRADPDTGDLTKAKVDALQFIAEHDTRIDCIDLKDAVAGGGSVAFGEGDANLRGVVQHLRKRQLPITAYIDCDYPGTGVSVEEVARCVAYIRKADAEA